MDVIHGQTLLRQYSGDGRGIPTGDRLVEPRSNCRPHAAATLERRHASEKSSDGPRILRSAGDAPTTSNTTTSHNHVSGMRAEERALKDGINFSRRHEKLKLVPSLADFDFISTCTGYRLLQPNKK
ncbi:unnamed protein product [Caenorhabditis auriculariae]|uniref:Uncharacterized protein n=1 Tax=Caenorhabditis auriculariae TaxID=2777116 RepID=A0A8S1GXI6_9PELO|nr:unnamed protein product [Caenorhabditis auriculariae]